MISSVRGYYASNVVGRVLLAPGQQTQVAHNYESIPGAIPIPATLSLELGRVISEQQQNITYRFVSDYPFANRDAACARRLREERARRAARQPEPADHRRDRRRCSPTRCAWSRRSIMGAACVTCHNTHPESPKRDWKVGDVRGIQEVTITQPIAANIFSFKYLLAYFALHGGRPASRFIGMQQRQAATIRGMNKELETANEFLATLSMKISRYLSPQIYKSIFSGQKDVTIQTERKKLTIFFSDIKDFTATTERLQPEEITALLNEYFTEMSTIALDHGGTIDKFIGDAILIFFGDPETKGEAEDAKACLRMAVDMQRRLAAAQRQMAQRRHRAAVPRAHGHQHRLLQCRQFRQRRPHGLHDHRRRGESRRAPAVDRRARRASSSATRPMRWCATCWWRRRCRRSR